jgi:hypothetical protein
MIRLLTIAVALCLAAPAIATENLCIRCQLKIWSNLPIFAHIQDQSRNIVGLYQARVTYSAFVAMPGI